MFNRTLACVLAMSSTSLTAYSAAAANDNLPAESPAITAPAAVAETPVPAADPPTVHKVKLVEGTEVPLLFVDTLSSATNAVGDRFTLRVDGNVKVGDVVVIPSGSIAVGQVTNARKKGYMGKAGELNIMLDHVTIGDDRIKLRASQGKEGEGKVGATVALTVLFGPLGLLKRGHDIEIKPGTAIMGYVDGTIEVSPSH